MSCLWYDMIRCKGVFPPIIFLPFFSFILIVFKWGKGKSNRTIFHNYFFKKWIFMKIRNRWLKNHWIKNIFSRGVHSGDRVSLGLVSFASVVFRIGYFLDAFYGGSHSGRVGSGRLVTVQLKIGYSSYRVSIISVSVEVRVECQSFSGFHRLIIGSVFPGTDQFRVLFT